jgi:hypothetical protein
MLVLSLVRKHLFCYNIHLRPSEEVATETFPAHKISEEILQQLQDVASV